MFRETCMNHNLKDIVMLMFYFCTVLLLSADALMLYSITAFS